jgi:nucleotide-binding universal stress UspA family protein
MLPVKRILWPTDFSEASYQALQAAVEAAQAFQAELYMLHVIPPIPALTGPESPASFDVSRYQAELEKSAERLMREVREKRITADMRVHHLISQGNPPLEIAREAEEKKIDLVVISTHGETGLKHLLFGSVAEKVMRHVTIPILVIHAGETKA